MANLYRKYMRLLEKIPVDPSRPNGLAQHIRNQVKVKFAKGENTNLQDEEKCKQQYEILERIVSNHWGKQHPNPFKQTALGLNLEQCRVALSKEFLELAQEKKLGFFEKMKKKFKREN